MAIGLAHYLTVAAILFTLGIFGIFLNRKNVIIMLMSIELMLLAVSINLVGFSVFLDNLVGQGSYGRANRRDYRICALTVEWLSLSQEGGDLVLRCIGRAGTSGRRQPSIRIGEPLPSRRRARLHNDRTCREPR